MPRLIDQDAALVELGMWPYQWRTMDELKEHERPKVYAKRRSLSEMLKAIRLPGEESRKYRTSDIEKLIEQNQAA